MPLHDHFHPPLSIDRPWEGFHSTWATAIAEQLNESLLPQQYVAIPLVTRGGSVEVDVATLRERNAVASDVATGAETPWQPKAPCWTGIVEWQERDRFEVRIVSTQDGPRLVAAVELVSPANKDRPAARQAFAGKCAGYLRQGVSLIVVDVVTTRRGNLHRELIELLELDSSESGEFDLVATAYRTGPKEPGQQLAIWVESLAVGGALPTMPLWLEGETAIPLDLDKSYTTACRRLRIAEE